MIDKEKSLSLKDIFSQSDFIQIQQLNEQLFFIRGNQKSDLTNFKNELIKLLQNSIKTHNKDIFNKGFKLGQTLAKKYIKYNHVELKQDDGFITEYTQFLINVQSCNYFILNIKNPFKINKLENLELFFDDMTLTYKTLQHFYPSKCCNEIQSADLQSSELSIHNSLQNFKKNGLKNIFVKNINAILIQELTNTKDVDEEEIVKEELLIEFNINLFDIKCKNLKIEYKLQTSLEYLFNTVVIKLSINNSIQLLEIDQSTLLFKLIAEQKMFVEFEINYLNKECIIQTLDLGDIYFYDCNVVSKLLEKSQISEFKCFINSRYDLNILGSEKIVYCETNKRIDKFIHLRNCLNKNFFQIFAFNILVAPSLLFSSSQTLFDLYDYFDENNSRLDGKYLFKKLYYKNSDEIFSNIKYKKDMSEIIEYKKIVNICCGVSDSKDILDPLHHYSEQSQGDDNYAVFISKSESESYISGSDETSEQEQYSYS